MTEHRLRIQFQHNVMGCQTFVKIAGETTYRADGWVPHQGDTLDTRRTEDRIIAALEMTGHVIDKRRTLPALGCGQ